jgi:amino-acid N-acetyltransferase
MTASLPTKQQQVAFVDWLRDSSPYIHRHRNSTFVISFGGEAVQSEFLTNLVHDFALLNSLGIRLVLVHGIRPQINQRLQTLNISPQYVDHLRITDTTALPCVIEAAGQVRIELESLLSLGLANSPMAGSKIRVVSGNYITAKPIGVLNGVDFQHTGEVRQVDSEAIHQQLQNNNVVLISSIGYSPSGDIFNLCAEDVATEVAIALQAEKLILMTEQSCNDLKNNQLIRQMTTAEAEIFIQKNPDISQLVKKPLSAAIKGCQSGVSRVHLIDRNHDGALLLELFSRDGIGTLISSSPFEKLRPATLEDISGILELINPLEKQGKLIKRSKERLEMDIADYVVIERDGLIIGCGALHLFHDNSTGEIACIAVHEDYQNASRGSLLLEYICDRAKQNDIKKLYLLSTQTMHWFIERGFQAIEVESLAPQLKDLYNQQRNSKIFCKRIS